MTGRILGSYQVLDPLGSGGTGEVYKARDTRLNRLVAIKVLREDLVATASRQQRFIQEAQSASALNHPNIVTICGFFHLAIVANMPDNARVKRALYTPGRGPFPRLGARRKQAQRSRSAVSSIL